MLPWFAVYSVTRDGKGWEAEPQDCFVIILEQLHSSDEFAEEG